MIKKIIGAILILVGAVILVAQSAGGGPLFPHVIGPTVLGIAGVTLVVLPQKLNKE